MKPRIRKFMHGWVCLGAGCGGIGVCPREAYAYWLKERGGLSPFDHIARALGGW